MDPEVQASPLIPGAAGKSLLLIQTWLCHPAERQRGVQAHGPVTARAAAHQAWVVQVDSYPLTLNIFA